MSVQWLYLVLVFLVHWRSNISAAEKPATAGASERLHRILVISLDGFGHEYIQKYKLEHLARIYARGSAPISFRNQFITKTYPNHFSVGTGVYEEVHGVVANNIFDPILKKTLHIDDAEFFTQNPDIQPVWTLNEVNGGHTGCIMWPGCGAEFHGRNVTFWSPYKERASLQESMSLAISWLTDAENPANLVFLYHEEPDASGHAYGPDSDHIKNVLHEIDNAIGFLFKLITINNLQGLLDIIILSDHGMSPVPEANIIDLDKIVPSNLYNFTGSSPALNVWVSPENQLEVYSKFLEGSRTHKYQIFYKGNIPDDWHYKKNPRISPILLLADDGYVFQDFRNTVDFYKRKNWPDLTDIHGDHGYPANLSSMEPIFVALGPSFKRRFEAPSFSNIDVYPLLCHMLSLTPGPSNGTLENISTILAQPITTVLIQPLLIALGCLVGMIAIIGMIAFTMSKRDSRRRVSADTLINGYVHRKTMRTGSPLTTGDNESEEESLLTGEIVTIDL